MLIIAYQAYNSITFIWHLYYISITIYIDNINVNKKKQTSKDKAKQQKVQAKTVKTINKMKDAVKKKGSDT